MRGVILAGNRGTALFALADRFTKAALPVAGEPLLVHQIAFFRRAGVRRVAVVATAPAGDLAARVSAVRVPGMEVRYLEEERAGGTAGCLRLVREFAGGEPLLVLAGNTFVERLDLERLAAFHRERRAQVTVVAAAGNGAAAGLENLVVEPDGAVREVRVLHASKDQRRSLRPAGIYLLDPRALDAVPDRGYMDLKEQLLPEVKRRGGAVVAYTVSSGLHRVDRIGDYFRLNAAVLRNGYLADRNRARGRTEILDRVWAGPGVRVAPTAYLLGPVVLGEGCVVEPHAQIIGPASLGAGCHVGRSALVRESVLWDGVRCLPHSRVEQSVVAAAAVVRRNQRVIGSVLVRDGLAAAGLEADPPAPAETAAAGVPTGRALVAGLRRRVYAAAKRGLDVAGAAAGLVLLAPVLLAVAAAVKLDSPGPVIFGQRRCGRGGRTFTMYKFRTMVRDAERLQADLAHRNEVDGPMFKISKDPRVTRVGRFLRRSSLDELPQLVNVLKGEMSLVGPRPLRMEEMAFSPSWRDLRLRVRPGMTGLWQVSGRTRIAFDQWIAYDVEYIRNQSLWLDLKILWRTAVMVLRGAGRDA